MRRALLVLAVAAPVLLAGGAYATNYVVVGAPARDALAEDGRNDGLRLHVRWKQFVRPGTLVVDLREVDPSAVAPIDLYRALFQVAASLYENDREFDRVELARRGELIFIMDGVDFAGIGAGYSAGENPVYMIRTLPEKLYLPSGEPAFGTWTGGWLGVLSEQMQDVSDAALMWIGETD